MSLSIAIVGLPNVGKSTVFNALTKNQVLAANYAYATIEPNIGAVPVPDARLGRLAEIFTSARIVPATVTFVDIAGLAKGASTGQGLGNRFLANIRETDAICQVIRVFTDPDVDGAVAPADDIETVNTELILADLQTIDRALPRLQKEARLVKGGHDGVAAVEAAREHLDSGGTIVGSNLDVAPLYDLPLLTAKPVLYVFNLDDEELGNDELRRELQDLVAPAEAIFLDAKVESELIELPDDEALELLQSVGQDESGLTQLVRVGFATPRAADVPHRRAEGIARLDDSSGRHRAGGGGSHPHRLPAWLHQGRDRVVRRPGRRRLDGRGSQPGGKVRLEGKDYVMRDGDVVEFRFNV